MQEVCRELKGKVIKTWQDGTERFYNDAKSIISNYSRSPSIASDIDNRSRSGSFDLQKRASFENLDKKKGVINTEQPRAKLNLN